MDLVSQRLLVTLYRMSRDTRHISASTLGRALQITSTQAARTLLALEAEGLADASRARLTMHGLVVAVASDQGARGGTPTQIALAATAQRMDPRAALPWAASANASL